MATFNTINSSVKGNNTFLGFDSGNFSLTGQYNVGVGVTTLKALTTGTENIGIGFDVMTVVTTGSHNVTLGNTTGNELTTGSENTIVGADSGSYLVTGSRNILLGYLNGANFTSTESDNIIIAHGYAGTNGQSHNIVIGITGSGSGEQNKCFIAGINGATSALAQQVVAIDANDELVPTGAATDGQVLIGATTSGIPLWSTITQGANVTITNAANSITIAAAGGSSFTWHSPSSNQSITVEPNNGYAVDLSYPGAGIGGNYTLTLDSGATWNVGDVVQIACQPYSTFNWTLLPGSLANVSFNYLNTLNGSTSIAPTSVTTGSSITLVCVISSMFNHTFIVTSATAAVTVS